MDEGRDAWCTPKPLADLIGPVETDPCSNSRSHIQAELKLTLEAGDNGLADYSGREPGTYYWNRDRKWYTTGNNGVVFINPPYVAGQVIRWVRHWRHTRFIFLLRFDPSTRWFAELLPHCTHIFFLGKRINFEPPPGVKSSSNPFPHALYLRDPSPELLARLAPLGYLLDARLVQPQTVPHAKGQVQRDTGGGGGSRAAARKAGGSGGKAAGSAGGLDGNTYYNCLRCGVTQGGRIASCGCELLERDPDKECAGCGYAWKYCECGAGEPQGPPGFGDR